MTDDMDHQNSPETVGADHVDVDDEQFCARCFAGVDSDEHHTTCVIKGYAYDGETAWGRWKRYLDRPSVWISNETCATRRNT